MLPVHRHGLMYPPRLLAVMLLLARHLRLADSRQAQTTVNAASRIADDEGTQGAGPVCEGRAHRRSPRPPRRPRASTAVVEHTTQVRATQVTGAMPRNIQGSEGRAVPPAAATRSEACDTAGLSVCAAYSRACQRVRSEHSRLQQVSCEQAPDPAEALSKLLQRCSPDVPASQFTHRASAATLSSLHVHELLSPHFVPIGRACSDQHVESSTGSAEVHGTAPLASHMNPRGSMHAACELREVAQRDGGYVACNQHTGGLASDRQGQVRFGRSETLPCDAVGDTEKRTQAWQGAGNRPASTLSPLSCGNRPNTDSSFATAWDKVCPAFSTPASFGCKQSGKAVRKGASRPYAEVDLNSAIKIFRSSGHVAQILHRGVVTDHTHQDARTHMLLGGFWVQHQPLFT